MRTEGAIQRAAGLWKHRGGIMPIRRTIIVPAIVALSMAGSILAGSAAPAMAAQASSAHVSAAWHASPNTFYRN